MVVEMVPPAVLMFTAMSSNVKVSVRVRPPLPRENADSIVQMPESEPGVTYLAGEKGSKKFIFDDSVWSYSDADSNYTDNIAFYRKSGPLLIDHLYQGYNVCLLAYGQTGSGKTHTMIGSQYDPGVIPQMVRDIMTQREELVRQKINCEVHFSYVEIYNEKVKDLLDGSKVCRVREHPVTGPFVENLTQAAVDSFEVFCGFLERGNAHRMTAATKMNDTSSRSHAVLTFTLKQTRFLDDTGMDVGDAVEEMVSNIKLVDLAGSERLAKTQVFGQADRMREGVLINKSLTVLGRCINILANKPAAVVPYRDSVLTYLLKENLAGNSKTAMVFCISPCDYEETLQTLNYANQVKRIKTAAKANSSTMLPAPPIDWTKLRDMDKTAIETLKDQIDLLTKEIDQLRSTPQPTESVGALMKYLERESTRQAFEIKYLKSVIYQQNVQVNELHSQNGYLHGELCRGDAETMRREHDRIRSEVGGLRQLCLAECDTMTAMMSEFAIDF